jgi:hypothetical protein
MSATAPTRQSGSSNTIALVILGVVLLIMIAAGLAGWNLPLLQDERILILSIFVLGQVMCAFGMRIGTFSWTHPSSIMGILLGVLLYLGVIGYLLGLGMPYLTSSRAVILFMGSVMLVKVLVDAGRMVLRLRAPATTS